MEDTQAPTGPGIDRLRTEPEARLDYLLARDVLAEYDDGSITATEAFDGTRDVYVDSYKDAPDEQFRETVADLFGLTVAEARERIDDLDLTRWEVATFLALRSYLDADLPDDVLLELAAMTAEAGSASPVPGYLRELFDDDFASFLDSQPHAVVLAFQQGCDPCDAMKAQLDLVIDEAPEEVAFAGIDGETAPEFRREFDVTVAPTTLLFADGDLVASREGYCDPDDLLDLLDESFPAADH